MTEPAIVDAGPLVAFFDPGDGAHDWAIESLRDLRLPLLTCEAVLVEAAYLLRFSPPAQDAILEWVGDGTLSIEFDLAQDSVAVRRLMKKYRDLPMSLADACLVRIAETIADHSVWTLDSDFRVYRTTDGAPLRLVIPDPK